MKRCCLLVACLLWPFEAHAQVPPSVTSDPVSFQEDLAPAPAAPTTTFRSHVDVVALNVVVTDGAEKFVTGLEPNDFAVYEDGVQSDPSNLVKIVAPNWPPVANGDSYGTDEDTPVIINLLAAASDVDGDMLTPILVAGPTHGLAGTSPSCRR